MVAPFVSIHGRRLGLTPYGLVADGRFVGNPFQGRGKFVYVDSAIDGTDGSSPAGALGTLDEAVAYCTANVGDTIVVLPNHAESVTGVGAIALDVAGINIIGLGRGFQMPQITLEAATTTVAVTAADVMVSGINFLAGAADVAACFDLDADGFSLIGNRFGDVTTDENFLDIIVSGSATNNVCDWLTVEDNYWHSIDAACTHLISHTGNAVGMRVNRNTVVIKSSTAGELINVAAGDLLVGMEVTWNFLQHAMTAGELFISNDGSTNSGIIAHNRIRHADVTTSHDLGIDGLGCALFDNLSTSVDNLSGVLLPAADVDS